MSATGAALSQAADTARIMAVLSTVMDPEIPVVSIIDLGIVRDVRYQPATVLLTPTYTGCPATHAIGQDVRAALDAAGFAHVLVETVLSPPWTTDWISDLGRRQLRDFGIAPPPGRAVDPVECPRCASPDTEEISRFGSTACKALWRCRSCREPFDRFKCH